MHVLALEARQELADCGHVRLMCEKGMWVMKKNTVKIGAVYMANVSGKLCKVKITGDNSFGGWDGLNTETNRTVRIKSGRRLRPVPKPRVVVKAEGKKAKGDATATQVKKAPKATQKATGKTKRDTGERGAPGAKRGSGLDAAAQVLADAKEPLSTGEMVERMLKRGLWKTSGKTPAATIYSAIIREMAAKGKDARFKKVDKGKFAFAG